MTQQEVADINRRIDNGDIFQLTKNKGNCPKCGAVTDLNYDNYCWKCGSDIRLRFIIFNIVWPYIVSV